MIEVIHGQSLDIELIGFQGALEAVVQSSASKRPFIRASLCYLASDTSFD
jgi:hypothetical protein